MPTVNILESSAGSAVGTNLTAGHRIQTSPMYRRIKRIGIVGSAVLRDGGFVDIYYGSTWMGTITPSTIGVVQPKSDADMFFVDQNTMLKPGEPLNLIVSKVGVTNALSVTLEIEEIHPSMFARRTTSYSRYGYGRRY